MNSIIENMNNIEYEISRYLEPEIFLYRSLMDSIIPPIETNTSEPI